MLITNISSNIIIKDVLNIILLKINKYPKSKELSTKIIDYASEYEYRLSKGRRDIIHIEDPTNESLNNQTFIIDYIDNQLLKLIEVNKLNVVHLKINDELIFPTTVTKIELLFRNDKLGFCLQNNLLPISAFDLLILDELGFKTLPKYSVDDFFNVVSKRYENNSIIITTNKDYENWNNIFEDEELTKAITDRLRHHGKVIKITGPSYRTKNQKSEVTVS